MDSTSLYYFSELAKDLHFTKTAERLFISQQTLSNHIQRLEDYYKTTLIQRKPYVALTYAGERVLSFAHEVLNEESNLMDILADIEQQERGKIRFGASTMRMSACLPNILPAFTEEYPHVEIQLQEYTSDRLVQMVLNHDLDIAITVSHTANPLISAIPLMHDALYFCVADELLQKYYPENWKELKRDVRKQTDLKAFSRIPFCMLENRMGTLIQRCLHDAGFQPIIYSVSRHIQIGTLLGIKGLAGFFATRTSLLNLRGQFPENINIFPLYYRGEPVSQEISVIRHEKRYLTGYMLHFISLLTEHFQALEEMRLRELTADPD